MIFLDAMADFGLMIFLDAYLGYHHIRMYPKDGKQSSLSLKR